MKLKKRCRTFLLCCFKTQANEEFSDRSVGIPTSTVAKGQKNSGKLFIDEFLSAANRYLPFQNMYGNSFTHYYRLATVIFLSMWFFTFMVPFKEKNTVWKHYHYCLSHPHLPNFFPYRISKEFFYSINQFLNKKKQCIIRYFLQRRTILQKLSQKSLFPRKFYLQGTKFAFKRKL